MQHIRPCYLPPHWWAYVHPEGQVYFAHESSLRIVTEAYLYSPEVQEKISYWIQRINDLLLGNKISLPETVELFLELDDTTDSCLYYFVDHATRTEFWLEETPMDLLGLPLVVSDSHLQLVLEELYWCHIEFFPSHRIRELHLSCDELVTIFVHARAGELLFYRQLLTADSIPFRSNDFGIFNVSMQRRAVRADCRSFEFPSAYVTYPIAFSPRTYSLVQAALLMAILSV